MTPVLTRRCEPRGLGRKRCLVAVSLQVTNDPAGHPRAVVWDSTYNYVLRPVIGFFTMALGPRICGTWSNSSAFNVAAARSTASSKVALRRWRRSLTKEKVKAPYDVAPCRYS